MERQLVLAKTRNTSSWTINVAIALSAALFLSSFAAFPWLEMGYEVSQMFAFHAVGGAIALYTLANRLILTKELGFNWLDVTVSGYSTYVLLRILTNPYLSWHSEHTLTVTLLLASYFFLRTFLRHRTFLLGTLVVLLIVALAQVAIGILQKASYLPAWHDTFRVSGTFFNPAPYAGFLVSVLPIALVISLKNQRAMRYLGIATTFGILLILPVTASRAAWLGAIAGVAVLLSHRWAIGHRLKNTLRSPLVRTAAVVATLLLVAGILAALFYIRPASALSRLLTWKVSASIIRDYPLWGVGYDQFSARFGQYQAEYFSRFPDDPLSSLAGQGEYAFNIFVELAVEQGLVGLALFGLMIIVALRAAFRSGDSLVIGAGASVIAILTFGLFSYPMAIIPIKINLFLWLAFISVRQRDTFCWSLPATLNRYIMLSMAVSLLLLLGYYDAKRYQAHQRWKVASVHKDIFNYQQAIPIYERIYPVLQANGKFLFQYGQTLFYEGEYQQAIQILGEAKQRTTDTYLYTALGESYQALEQYQKAEEAFQLATYHNPYRFYPRYRLVQLYMDTKQPNKALATAEEIITMDVKVDSPRVKDIRKEMQELVKKYDSRATQTTESDKPAW